MNRAILNDRLVQLISHYSKEAREGRQISARLKTLLPLRFREVRNNISSSRNMSATGQEPLVSVESPPKGARAMRQALVDPQYLKHLQELVDIHAETHLARVQYETHTMLFQARQTLRRFVR